MSKSLTNDQIATLAVYMLGGDSRYVDTEDTAVKVNELAPGRFVWRKYKDQIDIDNVRWALLDAKKEKNGKFIVGSAKEGWMLTRAGVDFCRSKIPELQDADLGMERLTVQERKWRQRERVRLLSTEAFGKFTSGRLELVAPQEAEAFFRLDDYVTGDVRKQKVARIENIFSNDEELGPVVKALIPRIRER